jgi:hypothetical protein
VRHFRPWLTNMLRMPIWSLYYLALVWVGLYFKWDSVTTYASVGAFLRLIGISMAVCVVITVIANLQVRSWRMIVFPFYAFARAMLMPLVGSIYYWMLARRQGFLGRYRFGYGRGTPPATPPAQQLAVARQA